MRLRACAIRSTYGSGVGVLMASIRPAPATWLLLAPLHPSGGRGLGMCQPVGGIVTQRQSLHRLLGQRQAVVQARACSLGSEAHAKGSSPSPATAPPHALV